MKSNRRVSMQWELSYQRNKIPIQLSSHLSNPLRMHLQQRQSNYLQTDLSNHHRFPSNRSIRNSNDNIRLGFDDPYYRNKMRMELNLFEIVLSFIQ